MDDFTQIKLTINGRTRLVSKEDFLRKRLCWSKTLDQHIRNMYIKLRLARLEWRMDHLFVGPLGEQDWGFTYIETERVRIDFIYS